VNHHHILDIEDVISVEQDLFLPTSNLGHEHDASCRGVFEKLTEKLTHAPTAGIQQRILPSFFELLKHLQSQVR